jgi:hypothetical protein
VLSLSKAVRALSVIALAVVAVATASAPAPGAFGPTDGITIAGLRRHLQFIASDALEGRDALSPGFRAAAEYVAATLDRIGATPAGDKGSYFQHVAIRRTSVDRDRALVAIGDTTFKYGDDFLSPSPGDGAGPLTYVAQGYRIGARHLDPFAGLDVNGRVLVVSQPHPQLGQLSRGVDYTTPSDNARAGGAPAVVSIASFERLEAWTRLRDSEAKGTLQVDRLVEQNEEVPTILAGPRLAAAIFRGERVDAAKVATHAADGAPDAPFAFGAGKRIHIHVPATSRLEDTENVVAVLEGADPVLKHEYVALGAHLDHLGKSAGSVVARGPGARQDDEIYNGADDDGSGVVALLEMAEAVASGPRPKRSLLFVWHTGEEYGSWGAKYFTAFPTVPLDSIIAQLNVDMVGRSRTGDDKSEADRDLSGPNEVYIIGSRRISQEMGDLCARVDKAFLDLALNYKYDDPADPEQIYERSDHYEYARKGIPVAFYFSGLHADYHRVTDEVGRIDFEKLQKVARTVLATAWTLANALDRPHPDHPATR